MDFELSDDRKMILESVATFVKKELPIERMRKMRADETGFSRDVYRQMGELGWLGIHLPESAGGFGGSFVDAAIILEQFGTTLVSEPYTASSVLGGKALALAANDEQQQRWLAPMIAGETVLSLAYAEQAGRYNARNVSTRAERSRGGYRLTGEKRWVLAGHAADQLIVSARTAGDQGDDDGLSLFVVDKDDPGLARKSVKTMDGRHAAMVSLDVEVAEDRLLGAAGAAGPILERVLDYAAAAACAEGYGILRTVLAMTVDYLKTREQFGVTIGSFQVLQHRAVDMFIETELAKSMSIMASIKVDDADPQARMRAVSAAKAHLATSGKKVTQQSIQLHGGIGVTDEHDVGLYFKRMHVLNALFGDEQHHVARFAAQPGFAAA